MNRRSLMLGGLIASAAGILGVKATKPVVSPVVEEYDGWDGEDDWDSDNDDVSPSLGEFMGSSDTTAAAFIPLLWSQEAIIARESSLALFSRVASTESTSRALRIPSWSAITPNDLNNPVIVTYKVDPNT